MAEGQEITAEEVEGLIKQALNDGVSREEILQGLQKDLQMSPEEAEQLVAAVEGGMGGGQRQGARDGSGQGQGQPTGEPQVDGMSLEEAMGKLEGLVEPAALIKILEVILSLSPDDIDQLHSAIQGAGQQEQAAMEAQGAQI